MTPIQLSLPVLNPADLVRLISIPVFIALSVTDIKTRRIPNRVWPPLVALGVGLICVDIWHALTTPLVSATPYLIQSGISIGFTIALAYGLWWLGGFGGADAKALMALGILFPTYPTYLTPTATLPFVRAPHGLFPLTILVNTVLGVGLYLIARALYTMLRERTLTPLALFGSPVPITSVPDRHGRLLETVDGPVLSGVDLDVIIDYLEWQETTIDALRANTDSFATPESDDPWDAATFLDTRDAIYYPDDPDALRDALRLLTETDRTRVWYTPGLPFFVPLTIGLLLALVVGSPLAYVLSHMIGM